jgi:hypothetical protein
LDACLEDRKQQPADSKQDLAAGSGWGEAWRHRAPGCGRHRGGARRLDPVEAGTAATRFVGAGAGARSGRRQRRRDRTLHRKEEKGGRDLNLG